jgi:putative transposase
MQFVLQPWQLFLLIVASWVNREQQQNIECLETQLTVLKEQFGNKRILLTDDQRRLLAVKGQAIGRKVLRELTTIGTPDTVLRWHRELSRGRSTSAINENQDDLAPDRKSWTPLSA